jgi:urate oxidase
MKLLNQRYGKSRVRVLKVLRDGPTHTIKELCVAVSLEGDFETSYSLGDNSKVVATDTMKNTVNALAKEHLGVESERFAAVLARHFVTAYSQVEKATVEAMERRWDRMSVDRAPHPHAFSQGEPSTPFTKVVATADGQTVSSGIKDLLILKSTESGFEGYPRDRFTTLPETRDRIFSTSLTATWIWTGEPRGYNEANRAILDAMLKPFATNYSPSVQTTLFEMGTSALDACPEISQIHLAMPNKHCLLINLQAFGLENSNEVFVPTDEPHGQIEATIVR